MKRLVVAPHCDDEVIGTGGYIAKFPDTDILVVAHADLTRRAEFDDARVKLGHTGQIVFLDFLDGAVGERPKRLVSAIDDAFIQLTPEEVLIPYPGSHQDHVATYEACVRAARYSLDPRHWMPPTVLAYETPTYDLDIREWPLRYSMFEVLDASHVMAKAEAMESYESQNVRDHPASPSQLIERARMIGLSQLVGYAEQFAPVRVVRQ